MLILFSQHPLSRSVRATAMLLTLGIVVSLFVGGAQPVAVNLIPEPWDKFAHGAIFALLAWTIGVASGLPGKRRLVVALLGSLLVGMLDEWHQMYLPGRQAGWLDLAADVSGSLIGTALLAIERIRRS
ncbi:VanZ family protein [Nitrosovibrio sp. Nv6]|uniref:VanZ family protein n=1 Tax=Nitrosovibrio sp. Nv6 TaxID=1855340 RepID=UPI001314E2BE|nr:VanZ family protein [Nitrosovibrio sp. Nv6]